MKPFRTLLLTAALAGTVLASSAGAASLSHTVAAGDTMWKLAVKYQVGTSEIIRANAHISNPDLIYPGQVLTIPQTDSTVSSFEAEVVRLVNEIRRQNGLSSLTANWELSRVARYKSQDMLDNRYFSHNSPTYGLRAVLPHGGGKHRQRLPLSPGRGEWLDEFQRPPGQYPQRLLHPDRRGLRRPGQLLDADVPRLSCWGMTTIPPVRAHYQAR